MLATSNALRMVEALGRQGGVVAPKVSISGAVPMKVGVQAVGMVTKRGAPAVARRMISVGRQWRAKGVKQRISVRRLHLSAVARAEYPRGDIMENSKRLKFDSGAGSIETAFARVESEGNQHGARNLGGKVNTIINICPQQEVWIVERFGKYLETAEGGLHFYVPIMDSIAYRFSLKEQALIIPSRSAITKDNVRIHCIGVLYYKIVDPKAAAYGCGNPVFALSQLAQTSLRSVLGRLTLDETFHERNMVNSLVVDTCNEASKVWGITCLRHEIREIQPPDNVLHAMEMQMEAERRKRVDILQSEGEQQALINRAEGHKREAILRSEAQKLQDINIAEGQAASIRIQAEAQRDAAIAAAEGAARSLERISSATSANGGAEAMQFELATRYIESLSQLAKTNNTMIVPSNVADVASMLSQATTIFQKVSNSSKSL